MKFRTLGRALLLSAGVAGFTLGLTSCSNDHTVGYVYVLGTSDASTSTGQVQTLKEDNNNGELKVIASPSTVGSGGTNPIRAVVPSGNRFMYVLNQGTPSTPDANGVVTYASSAIELFTIGGFGELSQQLSYNSQGTGAQRIAVDGSGTHIFVLDEYANVGVVTGTSAPNAMLGNGSTSAGYTAPNGNYPCQDPTNPAIFHPVGSITSFSIDTATGRLQVQPNAQQQNLTYFPVGCFPVDFRLTSSYIYTMDAGAASNNDQQTIYVYALAAATGQLTPAQTVVTRITSGSANSPLPNITAITGDANPTSGVGATRYLYLLDTATSQIYAYTISVNGTPIAISGSPFSDLGTNISNVGGPRQTYTDSTGKFLFVVNGGPLSAAGNNVTQTNADVSGFIPDPTTGNLNTTVQTSGFILGTVSGPVCLFEDPSNQFFYVAGSVDNSITGRKINPGAGTLVDLVKNGTVPTIQTPSWCLSISSVQ